MNGIDAWLQRPLARRALLAARIASSPLEFLERRRVARSALARASPPIRVDPRLGLCVFGASPIPGTDAILERCRELLERARPHLPRIRAARAGKLRLTVDLFSDDLHRRDPAFLDFALQDAALLPVIEYLATVPNLARVTLALSADVDGGASPAYHQRFHADNDDLRQVKLFLDAQDVDLADGPLTILPADASARVLRDLRRDGAPIGRTATYSDAEVLRHCDPSELVRVVGPAGSGAFVDLSRCLHFGSRTAPGRERLVLVASFLRFHRLHENASNRLDPDRPGLDALRRLALRSPRPPPHGYFCPDPLAELGP
jgi:hypothetical protein